jgi:tRNA (mo5U34)-methyltransferase
MRTRTILRTSSLELSLSLRDSVADRIETAVRAVAGAAVRWTGRPGPPGAGASVVQADGGAPVALSPERAALQKRVEATTWYQTIDLGEGLVTPGFFDHRRVVGRYGIPERLEGCRALDVATYNGFWAFELERRGADEVVAIDIDRFDEVDLAPRVRAAMTPEELAREVGTGFSIAKQALSSQVRRESVDVYALSPARVGTFDLVFCSDLLLHLTNPVRALQNIRSVASREALIVEMYNPALDRSGPYRLLDYRGGTTDFIWWMFGKRALEQMIHDSGFSTVELVDTIELAPRGSSRTLPRAVFRATV